MTPLLGWIPPEERTQEMQDAHLAAVAEMPRFALADTSGGPVKVILTEFFKRQEVLEDIGFEFDGFRQLTGSCVGVSTGDVIATVAALQRCIADAPTKAFVPWWAFPYGRCRLMGGSRSKGEGAATSLMARVLTREGVFDASQQGLPTFSRADGLSLPSATEYDWSDGDSQLVEAFLEIGKKFPVGTVAPVSSSSEVKTGIINGYPNLNGCNLYVGGGSIRGEGANAYVRGKYSSRGGHATAFIGYWDHPNDGPLFLYWNQWARNTYPKDPAGGPRCSVWIPQSELDLAFRNYGMSGGESMNVSHVTYFPAQPKVLDNFI